MIHIYFRTSQKYNTNNRPDWFSFENCWKNLVETKEDCRLTVIHDGLLDREYEGADSVINVDAHEVLPVLLSEWEQGDETYIDHDENGNKYEKRVEAPDSEKASGYLLYQHIYDNIEDLDDQDIIYIVEDDYIHIPGWVTVLKNLYELYPKVNYFSLYDHPDKYSQRYAGLQAQLFISNFVHWRTTPSTCGTFGGKVGYFKQDKEIHHYNLGDHNKFLKLTQKGRHFISPLPGLATHCVNPWVSPFRDWANV